MCDFRDLTFWRHLWDVLVIKFLHRNTQQKFYNIVVGFFYFDCKIQIFSVILSISN